MDAEKLAILQHLQGIQYRPDTQPPGSFKSSAELKSYQGMFRGAAEVSDFALVTEYSAIDSKQKARSKSISRAKQVPCIHRFA